MDLKRLKLVPNDPGVYIWKDKWNQILYIGKAKKLRSRMEQYFKGMLNSYKTSKLVAQIVDFEYILTPNDRDALILERNLIQKHLPPFNLKLVDDKHYPYIQISLTNKLEIKLIYRIYSQNKIQKYFYYGPFPNGYGARKINDLLNRMYTYKKGLPLVNQNYQTWLNKFNEIKKLLTSKMTHLIKTLKIKMNQNAQEQKYEIAHEIKLTISALEAFEDKQTIKLKNQKNIDVIAFIIKDNFLAINMLFYRQGNLLSKQDKIIEILTNPQDTIRQFISQYYQYNLKPETIISNLDFETENINLIVPKKGFNQAILKMALSNIKDNLDFKLKEFKLSNEATQKALVELQKILKLSSLSKIAIIDTSHTNNTLPIAVVLIYQNGQKHIKEFRKYNLHSLSNKSDTEYIYQTLNKHFLERKNPEPDLLIVDGGKAQLNVVKKLLPNLNVIGLVKNKKHQTDHIINQDRKKIKIKDQNLYNFLSKIQIEVDRYAKVIHRHKRKSTLEGFLTTIKGIGPATEKKLLNHFKNYANIYNASFEQLSKVVSPQIAKMIKIKLGEK